jgi:hypothetical protein
MGFLGICFGLCTFTNAAHSIVRGYDAYNRAVQRVVCANAQPGSIAAHSEGCGTPSVALQLPTPCSAAAAAAIDNFGGEISSLARQIASGHALEKHYPNLTEDELAQLVQQTMNNAV